MAAAADTAAARGKCTRRFARNVKKNAKSLLNPGMIVRYTARIVFLNARAKDAKRRGQNRDSEHFFAIKYSLSLFSYGKQMINRMKGFKPGLQSVDKRELYLKGIRSVVVLGDNGCRPPEMIDIDAFKKILKIKTDFFIIVGDLVFKGEAGEFRKLMRLCRKAAGAPIFTLAGNHDLPMYSKFCGRTSYAIILDRFGFICLDNAKRRFKQSDVDLLKGALKKHPEKKFFVLFHIPPPLRFDKSHIEYAEWEKIKRVLDKFKERIVYVFCGHIHAFLNYRLDGYRIIITGGGGAKLFNLKEDRLKAHHAVKLSALDGGQIKSHVIAVTGIKKQAEFKI